MKGGVGKTTTTTNLAVRFAENGHKTLIVDLDLQCNTTGIYVDSVAREENVNFPELEGEELDEERGAAVPPVDHGNRALWDFYANNGATGDAHVGPINNQDEEKSISRLLHDVNDTFGEHLEFLRTFEPLSWDLVVSEAHEGNLFIVKGSPSFQGTTLGDYDLEKSFATLEATSARADAVLQASIHVGSLRHALKTVARRMGIKFIIIDLSPSAGALSRFAFHSSDFILPPASAGLYSVQAVQRVLTDIFPKWAGQHRQINAAQMGWAATQRAENPASKKIQIMENFMVSAYPPKLFPFLVNKIGVRYPAPNTPTIVNGYAQLIADMRKEVQAAAKKNENGIRDLFVASPNDMVIPFLNHLFQTASVAGAIRRPEVAVTADLIPRRHKESQRATIISTVRRTIQRFDLLVAYILDVVAQQ